MVIVHDQSLSDSYIINGDGSQRLDVQITSPDGASADYAAHAQPAMVAGKLHLFGGWTGDDRKIMRLDDCAMVELAARLNFPFSEGHSALATDNGQKALICFDNSSPYNHCDVFDGSTATATFSSAYSHRGSGNLGYYNGNPTSVGSFEWTGNHKVETLDEDGWRSLADHPENTRSHSLVGLPNGDMLLIGGKLEPSESIKSSIWKLSVQGEWSIIGLLQQAVSWPSVILEGNSIYSFGGRSETTLDAPAGYFYPVQRIDLTEDYAIEQVELIAQQSSFFYNPYLLLTDTANQCITF